MTAERKSKTPLHLRLTCEDWVETFKELNRAELGVLYYIRCLDPYGDRELEVDSNEVSEKLGIHRTSVSRALRTLSEKHLIALEVTKAKVSSKAKNLKSTLLCMDAHRVHGRTTVSADAQQVSADAQQVSADAQQVSADAQQTYIRIAHTENTSSDLNQTHSNNPGGGVEFASPEEEPGIPSKPTLPSQPCQPTDSNNDKPYPGDKSSAGGCDNSAFVGHGNVAPDGKTRPFNQMTGKWSSVSSDPWMEGINPLKEFKQWVCKQAIAKGKAYSEANAAGEIRNNFQRAADLWDEYQATLTPPSTPSEQPHWIAMPDQLLQPRKKIKLAGKI